ncbi:MAG: 3-dehydroquinate synthase [Bacteroidia bacterium]|nr:3-dehydroquinate synthase [Bacteroidia bacterium]
MKKIIINTPESLSAILIGARWEAVAKLLPKYSVAILTDSNLFKIYGDRFPGFPVLKIRAGEESKQFGMIEKLSGELLKMHIDRTGFILAIGGGVVCDVAGFLASVYLRGIRCGYVSTSLLSQVDASTGGKTGVNLGEVKNVIGTFRQPEFVICDTTMLRTLPDDEYLSGVGELIKTGLIGDKTIIDTLENNYPAIIKRDRELLADLVFRSVRFKASVVAKDEKESGLRRILNFGHTFGHAVELHEGVKHGFAVAAGIELATLFSYSKGLIKKNDCDRIKGLLRKYNFTGEFRMPVQKVRELISHDKKKAGNEIHFVFLKGIGKPIVARIPLNEIVSFYRHFKRTNK